MNFFATTPKGLELLLVEELRALGATLVAEKLAGVAFSGDLRVAYKACLWSRLANRILLPIANFPASTPEELYAGVKTIEWHEHLEPEASLHVHFISSQSEITHTLFGAQKVKDAIVDQFREKFSTRPSVAKTNPDVSVHVYLYKNIASVSIDLSGESLHKRGYRTDKGLAPLKENLAAAILSRAGWKSIAAAGGTLVDPMCGSGTFLIEAAQIAGNIAPGLARDYYSFLKWKQHDAALWAELIDEAEVLQTLDEIPAIIGYDTNPTAIKNARANIERAGMSEKIHVEKQDLKNCNINSEDGYGLFVVNPPYGERLGEQDDLKKLYSAIGDKLKNDCVSWRAAVFTGNPDLGKVMGIRARKHYALFNGAIPCQLLLFDVYPEWFVDKSAGAANERRIRRAQRMLDESDLLAVQMFVNRLQKNSKHLKRWADRENITSYRIYDADLPEYAVSVDRYEDDYVIREYPAPKSIDKTKSERRLMQILSILPEALETTEKNIYLHHYHAKISPNANHLGDLERLKIISENGVKIAVDLSNEDLDITLPLYQRALRTYIQKNVEGKHVLNLFSHSGINTVLAALAGAAATTSVDNGDLYVEWLKHNLHLNELSEKQHQMISADPIEWVKNARLRYDVILIDVLAFSGHLREVYQAFIADTLTLLKANGKLMLISMNSRFKPQLEEFVNYRCEDLNKKLTPPDFDRKSHQIHFWEMNLKSSG